jgi:hypothetical protein
MKFLNIDMHISVIQDVQHILGELGHEVARHSLSGHNWVDKTPETKLSVVNQKTWKKVNERTVAEFFKRYKKDFANYDGFIHSYPPAFALLFEPFEKPVITVTCTRFDYPTFPENYQWLVEGLRRMHASVQLTLTANNRLDKMYNERFLGIETRYISSLCAYIQPKTQTLHNDFLFWARYRESPPLGRVNADFTIRQKYDRESVRDFAGVIHYPYNLSIMSAFEHYWQNIPLYFPSVSFQKELLGSAEGGLQEVLFPRSALYFEEEMIELADWYDQENFAGVRLFDSWEMLGEILESDDLDSIRFFMEQNNLRRKSEIMASWSSVLSGI